MDRWDDVRTRWPDGLVPVPEQFVSPLVTARTREFLTTVGLPTSCPMETLTFYHDERLRAPLARGGHTYVTFGDDYEVVPFVLRPGRDEVYDIYPKAEEPSRFINSTLPDFIYSLGLFCSRIPQLRAASDRELKPLVQRLRTELRARDTPAMSSREHWWPRLLNQALERFV